MQVCVNAQWREHPSPSISPTCATRKQSRVFLSAPQSLSPPLTWACRQWGHQMTLHQHFRPGRLSTHHHHHKRHNCWTSCQLQKRLALLKNNVAVRSPRISPSPQREGRCRGSLPRALCSQAGPAASPLQPPVACLSFSKKSKVPDNSLSGRVSFGCPRHVTSLL